jgi:Cu/Ag efflux protein CusF
MANEGEMNRRRNLSSLLAFSFALTICHEAAAAVTSGPSVERPRENAPPLLAQQSEPSGLFHGDGLVLAVDAKTGALTLKHSDIPGFMPAMEMMFRVDPPSLSDGLRKGDRIEFTIEGPGGIIRGLKLIRRAE